MNNVTKIATIGLLSFSQFSFADVSSTVALTNNYLFNGITQTDKDPALQVSLDWANDEGWYLGTWASNVDFGDDTDIEVDFYGGYAFELNSEMSVDLGFAHYTYHGGDDSSDINYTELYSKFALGNAEVNFWYSPDFVGSDAGHFIAMFNYNFPISDELNIQAGIDYSKSLDDKKYEWQAGKDNYLHYQVSANYAYSGFDFTLGIHQTNLDAYDDTSVQLMVARTFSF